MNKPTKLAIVLHAHLPYVRNPDHPRFLEENWFFEAMFETYLPFLQMCERLEQKAVPVRFTLSLSPPLVQMMQDELLIERFSRHLRELIKLSEKEMTRYSTGSMDAVVAEFYHRRFLCLQNDWENRWKRNIPKSLARLEKSGLLELFTCAGTHPYLPACETAPEMIRGHLRVSQEMFQRVFGRKSQGIWLPECAYFPGLDEYLADEGFQWFLTETHGTLMATPPPARGVFQGIRTPAGLVAFGRDQASSQEVWSRQFGYPGHPDYREFFKDLKDRVSAEYLGRYFHAGDSTIDTGLKYWAISGSEDKRPYEPFRASQLARQHAAQFVANRMESGGRLREFMDTGPVIVAPYDAELFGHWWFEGPVFLEQVAEECARYSGDIRLCSIGECTAEASPGPHQPAFSSWGEGGFGTVWINPETDFIYPLGIRMQRHLSALIQDTPHPTKLQERILNQLTRELLLFQSSDWAFMIHNHSAEDYARDRIREHADNFTGLLELWKTQKSGPLLAKLEGTWNIFPWIDYRWFT